MGTPRRRLGEQSVWEGLPCMAWQHAAELQNFRRTSSEVAQLKRLRPLSVPSLFRVWHRLPWCCPSGCRLLGS